MIVSVTALGFRAGDAAGAVARVVDYLEGRAPAPPGRSPKWWQTNSLASPVTAEPVAPAGDGVLAYYADSVEGPGRWLGRGLAGHSPTGEVARDELARMLLGQHPTSGCQLLDGRGSALRAHQLGRTAADVAAHGPDNELLTMPQAAALIGVSPQYLRNVAMATAKASNALGNVAGNVAEVDGTLPALDHPYLDAAHAGPGGHWRVTRAEVARFIAARNTPAAVIGYDVTFSVPKSVSLLWAQASPAGQESIVAAVHAAVTAGVAYLEDNAAFVRTGWTGAVQPARGLLAASYLHATSRALDPQLHAHVVVANMAEGPDGKVRALDGRALYAHAMTASHLAAAQLRLELTRRLGVEWQPVERGLADVVGVPRKAIDAMSKRSQELESVLPQIEAFFTGGRRLRARGRQMAAYITRAAKDEHGVDPAALRPWWSKQLDGVGFGPRAVGRCLHRQVAPALVTAEQRVELFARLGSAEGVTEMAATFSRRDVIQSVADWAGDRLDADAICHLADAWMTTDVVVRLEPRRRNGREADVIRLRHGQTVNAVGAEPIYTTTEMLGVEERLLAGYARGRHVGAGVVPAASLQRVLAARPGLGQDQVAMVSSICASGHRVQCVLGPAGSGKTFALAAAAVAWEEAGYRPIGAVVQGTATEVLRDATGLPCSTLASLMYRLDTAAPGTVIDKRSVVIVDEASTIPNRELARLIGHVDAAGATLRLIGDPAQHTAVAAGGGWRALLERYPEDRAELVERRRQGSVDMTEVRLASDEYAAGQIAAALERLRRNDRVVEADTPEELLDALVADWYVDRMHREADPSQPPSSMMADHHVERRELNARARTLLAARGVLTGPVIEGAGASFQAGDEVIAVQQQYDLRAPGSVSTDFVRTGERGRVVEVRPGSHPVVVVDFERRGCIEVGEPLLTKAVRPGVVGVLAHSYAVTSHMAEGETYQVGRHLSTDASSRAGVYVGLTRGRGDARLYMVRRRDLVPSADHHVGLPRLEDDSATLEAVVRRLEAQRSEYLATEADPAAAEVARLRRSQSLAELVSLARNCPDPATSLPARAYREGAAAVAAAACLDPEPALVARLGSRPTPGPDRRGWDRVVGEIAVYRARFGAMPIEGGAGATWALGPVPTANATHYEATAEALRKAEVARLAQRTPNDLAVERRALGRTLAVGLTPDRHDQAAARVATARRQVDEAESERQRLARRVDELEAPGWHRNRHAVELARRSLRSAEQRRAVAVAGVQRAEVELGSCERELPAQQLVQERLSVVEAALDRQVATAVAAPAAYLLSVLGDAPDPAEERGWWHEAAERIESYRHQALGRSPADGRVVDQVGLEGAIGPRPDDYLDALTWDHVADAVAPDLAPELDASALGLGM